MIGEEGRIKILDEAENEIGRINKESEVDENGPFETAYPLLPGYGCLRPAGGILPPAGAGYEQNRLFAGSYRWH